NVPQSVPTSYLLANDTDPKGQPLTVVAVSAASSAGGTVALNDNGTPADPSDDFVQYTPPAGFVGTDTFTYTVANTAGGTASATRTMTVSPPGLYLVRGTPGGPTTLTFTFESREAAFQNQFGFAIADSTGAVNGVAPGSDGYVQAVVTTGTVVFDDRTNLPG